MDLEIVYKGRTKVDGFLRKRNLHFINTLRKALCSLNVFLSALKKNIMHIYALFKYIYKLFLNIIILTIVYYIIKSINYSLFE